MQCEWTRWWSSIMKISQHKISMHKKFLSLIISLSTVSPYGLTIADILDVSLNFLQALINVVEGSEPDIPLYLSPWWQLVYGPFRTLDLGRLHCGGSGKLVFLLISMLKKRWGICSITMVANRLRLKLSHPKAPPDYSVLYAWKSLVFNFTWFTFMQTFDRLNVTLVNPYSVQSLANSKFYV